MFKDMTIPSKLTGSFAVILILTSLVGYFGYEAAKKLGIAEQTLIRWRKEYGGLRVDQARRFKELEKENIRLKQLVADLSLDKAILKDAASGNL